MASKHTEHFDLNQWELSDSVIMSDFNEDNAKIEQALLETKTKFHIDTYVGTGTWGENAPCTLTFPFEPKLVIIALEPLAANFDVDASKGLKKQNSTLPLVAIHGAATALLGYDSDSFAVNFQVVPLHLSWQDTTLSWYLQRDESPVNYSHLQLNYQDMTYRYIALG